MPRITAATMAANNDQRRRALLDAARSLLAETGEAPPVGLVATRAGLARTSVYQYFSSVDELLTAVVADVLPDWASQVADRVAHASTPGGRVWAYIEANVDLFAGSEQAVALALARVVDPAVLQAPLREFHARLQLPLLDALHDLGEPEPAAVAEHIDSLIMQATRGIRSDPTASEPQRAQALARLRRLLSGYLTLPPNAD